MLRFKVEPWFCNLVLRQNNLDLSFFKVAEAFFNLEPGQIKLELTFFILEPRRINLELSFFDLEK
jgi:hypothetical protein